MKFRWCEIWPSDVTDTLNFLRERAIEIRRWMAAPLVGHPAESTLSAEDFAEFLKHEEIEKFTNRIREKADVIGEVRVSRILLTNTPTEVQQPDKAPPGIPERWIDAVLFNIEHELNEFDSRRMTWMVAASMIAAIASAAAASALLFIEVIKLVRRVGN
jgi:hypothetical protein